MIAKKYVYHNFYLFFPVCKRKEFDLFQPLENFKKKLLMHRPVAKDCPCINRGVGVHMIFFDLLNLDQSILDSA